jgi:hypothetical protein
MKKTVLLLISICCFCLLNGCGSGSSSPAPPPVTTHFSVTAASTPQIAGTPFNITVTALDASNSTVSTYTGTVHFASSDAQAVLPGDSTLTNGTKVFSVTLKTAIDQTITVSDTAGALTPATSSAISVNAAPTSRLLVMAPASTTVGAPFGLTVTAQDQFSNTTATYSGTVQFSSSDGSAVLPLNATLTNGTRSFSAILKTTPNQTITAMDIATHSINGTSGTIGVTPSFATHFAILTPANTTAGSLFSLTVTALDLGNNVATGYSGVVTFTSTDPLAVLPLDSTLTNGTADFPATLKTPPNQTITVGGKARGLSAATSSPIIVSAATAENPVPFINQPIIPSAVAPGGGAFALTIIGTGFVPSSTLKWNGKARTTSFVSSSKLTAAILASDVANANTASLTVFNPTPGGGTSNVVFFEVTLSTSSISLMPSHFVSSLDPYSVVVGDFNGDGKLDLAVAHFGNNIISISLGNGDGTFQAAVAYALGNSPYSVAIGDFNGDGKLDLVTANENGSGSVSVMLGNGDGTFQPVVNYPAGTQPGSLAVGDFNGDGKLDLVTANYGSNNMSILLGNGDGTFQPPLNFAAGAQPGSVAVGDFNGDGKLDLAVTQRTANVSVFLGNGDGTFLAPVNYPAGAEPFSLVIGDFNGDGKLDLAVGDFVGNGIKILLGNGDGTLRPATNFTSGTGPRSFAVGDFNGDGKLDLVVANGDSNNLSVLLGNGDGTFQAPLNFPAGNTPVAVAAGDFNGNGRLDFAIADLDFNNPAVSILLQDDTLGLSPASLIFSPLLVGTSSGTQAATLTNNGFSALAISGVIISGTDAADFAQTDACGSGITARASCTVNVTFTPAQIGPRTSSLVITDNAAGSPQSVALSGIGLMTGHNATLAPATVTFAPQIVGTTSSALSVTLSNYGTTPLNISSIAASADFAQTNTCGSILASGASCSVNVSFTPTTADTLSGTLSVSDDAPGSPQTVALNGIGAGVTTATLTPSFITLNCRVGRNAGCDPPVAAKLMNTGNSPLYITGISISPAPPFSQTNNCPSSLAAGQFCMFEVSFNSSGPRDGGQNTQIKGALAVNDTATGGQQTVALTGNVIFLP